MEDEDIGSFGLIFELYFVVRKYTELYSYAEEDSKEILARAGLIEAFQPVILHWIMLNKASAEKWVKKVRLTSKNGARLLRRLRDVKGWTRFMFASVCACPRPLAWTRWCP